MSYITKYKSNVKQQTNFYPPQPEVVVRVMLGTKLDRSQFMIFRKNVTNDRSEIFAGKTSLYYHDKP